MGFKSRRFRELGGKINAGYAETIAALPENTDVAFNERNWLEPVRLEKHLSALGWKGKSPLAVRFMGDSYLDRWIKLTGEAIGRGDSDTFLLAVSLFKSVPWSAKT